MKDTFQRVWWKVPLYCIVAGFISWWLMVSYLGRLAIKRLPDGTITSDNTVWMLLSGVVFVVVLLLGGLMFFRKMTRKELLCSTTVMFALNVIMGVMAYVMPTSFITMFFVEMAEWYSFVPQVFYRTGINPWIGEFVGWSAVYLFVLFGKKEGL